MLTGSVQFEMVLAMVPGILCMRITQQMLCNWQAEYEGSETDGLQIHACTMVLQFFAIWRALLPVCITSERQHEARCAHTHAVPACQSVGYYAEF